MSSSFVEIKRELLEKQYTDLIEEYRAAHGQLRAVTGEVDRLRIQRQIEDLEQRIEHAESALKALHNLAIRAEPMPEGKRAQSQDFDPALGMIVQDDGALTIGRLPNKAEPAKMPLTLRRSDFARHCVVIGVTGSGKTNTVFSLVDQLWDAGRGVPFLLIEPAKTDYRDLRSVRGFDTLRVYTLGNETVAPFRLNPFQAEIGPLAESPIQMHIENLVSVFSAAFRLHQPMPHILRVCMHEIYEEKGWDLTTGTNRRLPHPTKGIEMQYPIFPTLSDFYRKIGQVVDRLVYDAQLSADIKEALRLRVHRLLVGSVGMMLDTPYSIPMADLLSHPTVLELESSEVDDQKAFLTGLILARVFMHRRVEGMSSIGSGRLRHVVVLEEAHRLWRNTFARLQAGASYTDLQDDDIFSSMILKLRRYGQGIILVEQIPTRLDPMVFKHFNLKIVHRMPAQDDREVLRQSMNLDESQLNAIARLRRGQVMVSSEWMDRPQLLRVADYTSRCTRARVTDLEIAQMMREVIQSPLYDPAPGYSQYFVRTGGYFDPVLRSQAARISHNADFQRAWARYFLSSVLESTQVVLYYPELCQFQRTLSGEVDPTLEKQIMLAVLLHTVAKHFDDCGRVYRWPFSVGERLRVEFVSVVAQVVQSHPGTQESPLELVETVEPAAEAFSAAYWEQVMRTTGPFAGCTFCERRCLYQREVAIAATRCVAEDTFVAGIRDAPDDQTMWSKLANSAKKAATELVALNDPTVLYQMALCYTIQLGEHLKLSSSNQHKLIKNVKTMLERREDQGRQ